MIPGGTAGPIMCFRHVGATPSRAEIEIVCDHWVPKGIALMFADALVVRSLEDDIMEIADYRAMRLRPEETPSSWMAL